MLHPPRVYLYLDAVARAGSIRKGAEKLHVASTALNRKILEIEAEIGLPLFERLPKGVRLTAAGEVLLATIRRSLSDLDAAASQIEQLRGMVRGLVNIGCAESVGTDLVPAVIARYQQQHPGVQFQIAVGGTETLLAALLADDVELLLAHDPAPSLALNEILAVPQPLCALMRPDHPLANRKSIRLADCQRHAVALGPKIFGSRRMIDGLLARSRMTLRVVLEASSVETLKVFVRESGAISFQFRIGTLRDTHRGDLVAIPMSDAALANGRLVLASRVGRTLPIAALSFIETLRAELTAL